MPFGAGSQSSAPCPGNLGAVLALWAVWKCHLPELEGMRPCGMALAAPCFAQALCQASWKGLGAE